MKRLLGADIPGTYTFSPSTRQITFSGLQYTITLANILLITNVTANTIIYNFADVINGQTSLTNNILTLDYNTTSMNAADVLQIYMDFESYEESLHAVLRRMHKLLESNAVVDSSLRQRISLDAINAAVTVPVSGSVTVSSAPSTAVTNATGFGVSNTVNTVANPYNTGSLPTQNILEGPVDQRWRIIDAARNAYGAAIRTNLVY
jgi:hypothetical protein